MKAKNNFSKIWILALSIVLPFMATSQTDTTGLPGDHFSLEAALEQFRNADSMEAFEKALNTEENHVNNLDLNEDGKIDYIKVYDTMEDDVHAITLQVDIEKNEAQDIAVIEIEKTGEESAVLQIIGDQEIYGENVIVEPYEEETTGGNGGPAGYDKTMRLIVNVWIWPSVRFIYAPRYRVWRSPWYWGFYPRWFSPWRPHPIQVFYPWRRPFRTHYQVVAIHRVPRAHRVYVPRRRTSAIVHKRYNAPARKSAVTHRSSTTIVKKGDKTVGVRKTKTSGAIKNNRKASVGQKSSKTVAIKKGDKAAGVKKTKKAGVKKTSNATRGAKRSKTVKKRKN